MIVFGFVEAVVVLGVEKDVSGPRGSIQRLLLVFDNDYLSRYDLILSPADNFLEMEVFRTLGNAFYFIQVTVVVLNDLNGMGEEQFELEDGAGKEKVIEARVFYLLTAELIV